MLPDGVHELCKKTMTNSDKFPFNSITHFLILGAKRFARDIEKAEKSKELQEHLVNDVIKDTKELMKDGMMSKELYGWKKPYREQLQK